MLRAAEHSMRAAVYLIQVFDSPPTRAERRYSAQSTVCAFSTQDARAGFVKRQCNSTSDAVYNPLSLTVRFVL
jgi:hypothetical protein